MKLKNFLSDNLSVGKGAVKLPIHELIEKYQMQYSALEKKCKVQVYKLASTGNAIAHVEVPSESVEDFYYDILLELKTDGADSYDDCHIKVFSNSPSFVYSYAYVFYHFEDPELKSTGMIIDKWHQKIPKNNLMTKVGAEALDDTVLKVAPVMRNPLGIPLFDKTIYYAIFALQEQVPFNNFKRNLKMIADRALYVKIDDFDKLMLRRKRIVNKNRLKRAELTRKKMADKKADYSKQERQHRQDSQVNYFSQQSSQNVNHSRQSSSSGVNRVTQSNSGGVNKVRSTRKVGK